MEDRKEKIAPWMSVPQFGDWDHQNGNLPDYSMDFSKIREMRKQNKRDISRASLGNEDEFVSQCSSNDDPPIPRHHPHHNNHSPTGRKSFLSYFNCCIKA